MYVYKTSEALVTNIDVEVLLLVNPVEDQVLCRLVGHSS